MLRKILKWTGIILLSLALILFVLVASRQNRKFDAPYPDIKASGDSAVIARGKEIIFGAGNCYVCHASGNPDSLLALGREVPLSGGRLAIEVGTLHPKNLTPDSITGIGRLRDAEIARILRYGVNPDGTATLMPAHNLTDEDIAAVISYLRAQPPVHHEVPPHSPNIMGYVVKAFMLKPMTIGGGTKKKITRDTTAAYGEYLAISVSDCRGCHTKSTVTGDPLGAPFAGGQVMKIDDRPELTTPNLTQHPSGRIYGWSLQNFIGRFRMGKLIPHSEMPWNAYKRMSDTDLTAIYNYLRSLPPAATPAEDKKK